MRDCEAERKVGLSFLEQDMPVLFSIRLCGTGRILLDGRPAGLPHTAGQLEVGFFAGHGGRAVFLPGTHRFVNIVATREVLDDALPSTGPAIAALCRKTDCNEKGLLRCMTAPTALLMAAKRFFDPPLPEPLWPLFFKGLALETLSICLGSFHAHLLHGKAFRLSRTDVDTLYEVRLFLDKNVDNPPGMAELCRRFCLNPFKLKKGFKQLFGVTLFGYVQNRRLWIAHERISQGSIGVSECAWSLGYTNVSHFISSFRRLFGHTPGECLRQRKEGMSVPLPKEP